MSEFPVRDISYEHRTRLERILSLIHAQALPFADTSPDAQAERRALPFFDWCATYLPHYFTAAPWSKHIDAERVSHEEGMPQFHCWSRGAGKSTIFSLAKPLKWILGKSDRSDMSDQSDLSDLSDRPDASARHFIILGGATEDVAIDKSDFIELELAENPRIRCDYGPAEVKGEAGARVMGDTLVWCRGIGQSTRGQRHRQWRPDAFIGDDLENDVLVRNPKREAELWDWLLGATFPGLESHGAKAVFIVVGTMYGRHCMMARAREQSKVLDARGQPICRYFEYALRDERGHSTWPERYSDRDLARACAVMGTRIARREIDCKEDSQDAPFRPEWIREFDSTRLDRSNLQTVAFLDPSAKADERHDYKALVVLAAPTIHNPQSTIGNRVYCLHAWIRHASPGEMIDQLFWVADEFGPGVIGCEANGFQGLIWDLLRIEQERRGRRFVVKPVDNRQNKQDRILTNQGEFERGLCVFDPREGDQQLLIDQFLDFGQSGVHDDGPDAWDGARRLLPGRALPRPFSYRGARRAGAAARQLFGLDAPRSGQERQRAWRSSDSLAM